MIVALVDHRNIKAIANRPPVQANAVSVTFSNMR